MNTPTSTSSSGSLQSLPTTVGFGTVPDGQTASSAVFLENPSSAAIQIEQVQVTGQDFSASLASNLPVTVPAGGTYTFKVNFSPDGMGTATGQVTIISNSNTSGPLVIGLSGTGTATSEAAPVSLSSLSCSVVSVTGAGMDSCTVALNGAAPSGGLPVALVSNNSAVVVPAAVTVAAGATSAAFTATISAVMAGQTAMLTATAGGVSEGFSMQLNVAAMGLNIDATSIAFGNVQVNTVATQSVELTVSGPLPIVIASATVQGTGFSVSGASFPLTLIAGQAATIAVTFDPTATGATTGQLIILSTSLAGGSATVNLNGTGQLEEVNLTWDAPSSSPDPVAGYNIYRASSGGTYYQQLNPSVVTQTSYIDAAVASGQTYDYIVESVDASGVTSTPSNTASVTLP